MMQNYPLSIFHASVRPESSPGADLSTFQKVIFSLILDPLGPNYSYSINYFNNYLGNKTFFRVLIACLRQLGPES